VRNVTRRDNKKVETNGDDKKFEKPITHSEALKASMLLSLIKREKAYTSEEVAEAEQKKKQPKDKEIQKSSGSNNILRIIYQLNAEFLRYWWWGSSSSSSSREGDSSSNDGDLDRAPRRKNKRRQTMTARTVAQSLAPKNAVVFTAPQPKFDHIHLMSLSVNAVRKFITDIAEYQTAYGFALHISTLIQSKVHEQIIARKLGRIFPDFMLFLRMNC
jgi:hypothetical protein